ncbi:RNA methyltransferase [Nanoarchaeota archaeon]
MDVVLIEPQIPGNIGAVARAMKNFGFNKLVLVSPCCSKDDIEAKNRAKHANDILDNAKIAKKGCLDEYDYVIGTTSRLGGENNIARSPASPKEMAALMKAKTNIALVFGRENDGLTNDEIAQCDFLVTIPTHPDYPAMNLSHAVTVLLYEINNAIGEARIGEDIVPIDKVHKDQLIKLIDSAVDAMEWRTETRRENQKIIWRKIIGKAMLTNREAQALMGLFRKIT